MAAPDLPPVAAATGSAAAARGKFRDGFFLARESFADLPGFEEDDHLAAFRAFAQSSAAIAAKVPPLRAAVPASPCLEAIAQIALRQSPRGAAGAKRFFKTQFAPCRILLDPAQTDANAFLTGYYEPVVEASPTKTGQFTAPPRSSSPRHPLL